MAMVHGILLDAQLTVAATENVAARDRDTREVKVDTRAGILSLTEFKQLHKKCVCVCVGKPSVICNPPARIVYLQECCKMSVAAERRATKDRPRSIRRSAPLPSHTRFFFSHFRRSRHVFFFSTPQSGHTKVSRTKFTQH